MSSAETGFNSQLFAEYASYARPKERIPPNILHSYTERTLTIIEQYPKSKLHLIMIPRVKAAPRVPMNLTDLYTWLTSSEPTKDEARALLLEMRQDAEALIPELKEEMESGFGYVGNFWMGFKVKPSYQYLHLHIMSDDLCGDYMSKPHHFFSFHPQHGLVYGLDKVLYWFEIVPEMFAFNLNEMKKKRSLGSSSGGERDSRGRLEYPCYHNDGIECNFQATTLSAMKEHLEKHANKRKEAFMRRKRAREALAMKQAMKQASQAEAEANRQGDIEQTRG